MAGKNSCLAPIAFGNSNVGYRIKHVLNFRTSRNWIILISIVLLLVLGLVLLTNPGQSDNKQTEYALKTTSETMARGQLAVVELDNSNTVRFMTDEYFTRILKMDSWTPAKEAVSENDLNIKIIIAETNNLKLGEGWSVLQTDYLDQQLLFSIPEGTFFNVKNYIYNHSLPSGPASGGKKSKVVEAQEIGVLIEENLNRILSSPLESSNPAHYIEAHQDEYQQILEYGQKALDYMLNQFEQGTPDDLRAHIMMRLCKQLMGYQDTAQTEYLGPQQWYNQL